ncbi:hypothetical protein B5F38_08310 [Barnesiella sp. An22]|nr:hypothetical protein B5F38_08310 [Barnesiella sp. An22]
MPSAYIPEGINEITKLVYPFLCYHTVENDDGTGKPLFPDAGADGTHRFLITIRYFANFSLIYKVNENQQKNS